MNDLRCKLRILWQSGKTDKPALQVVRFMAVRKDEQTHYLYFLLIMNSSEAFRKGSLKVLNAEVESRGGRLP